MKTLLFAAAAMATIAALGSGMTASAAAQQDTPANAADRPTRNGEEMNEAALEYPETRRQDLVEDTFGEQVADPYRWLENDVREDNDVRAWVEAENRVTDSYLATLPGREVFANALRQLIDYERFSLPQEAEGKYIYTYNDGLQNQAVLMIRDSAEAEGRVLLDPNTWSQDDTIALGGYDLAPDGRHVVYAQQDGGSDWRTVLVVDTATGETLDDRIEWMKFSGLDWDGDSQGFFYSRFQEPAEGQKFQSLNLNQQLYYHKLGTAQTADRLVYKTPDEPKLGHTAEVTDDGRWLVIYSVEGTDERVAVHLVDLQSGDWTPRALVAERQNNWNLIGSEGETLYFITNADAPRQRVVAMDVGAERPQPRGIVAEDEAVLDGGTVKDGKLYLTYLDDVKTDLRRFDLDGSPLGRVELPGIGTAYLGGEAAKGELYYGFTSFTVPDRIYRLDTASGDSAVWEAPEVPFDPEAYTARQVFYPSKDGTEVPMFIVHRRDLDMNAPQPTLLYGYGGFNISLTPGYSPARMAWMAEGGVLAVANLRGGGEYGKAWHDAGRLMNKQNVFDDFIAAGEYLVESGVTAKDKLAIQGGSNGGLLVGAVTNQRPDLFAAAMPAVGVMDMLRFDQFTAGRYWVDDYGYPDREADFRNLLTYSPYHNIESGKDYPAILVTTADTDDRVVPGHSFKYTAALQAADIGTEPHLIRIETRAGHGSGKPVDKIIEEYSDLWAFAAAHTGLTVEETPAAAAAPAN